MSLNKNTMEACPTCSNEPCSCAAPTPEEATPETPAEKTTPEAPAEEAPAEAPAEETPAAAPAKEAPAEETPAE